MQTQNRGTSMNKKASSKRDWGRSSRADKAERLTSLIGGSALAAWGIKRLVKRRSVTNLGLATAAGLLVYNGIRNYNGAGRDVHLEATFTINKPPEELYRYWRNAENLPKFMHHVESVQANGKRLHWVARGPLGAKLSWDTEITDDKENEWIVWRSLEDSALRHSGSVHFRPAPGNRGTVVTVAIQYQAASSGMARVLLELLGKVPEFQLREELRHFKQLVEAGEIPTTEGQPSGRRSTVVSLMQKVSRRPRLHELGGARTA
jgi:uncharacterized membrane protein